MPRSSVYFVGLLLLSALLLAVADKASDERNARDKAEQEKREREQEARRQETKDRENERNVAAQKLKEKCEELRIAEQAAALKALPPCAGYFEFDFRSFGANDFSQFCSPDCSLTQGTLGWQQKVAANSAAATCLANSVSTKNLDVIAAFWCNRGGEDYKRGDFCFQTLFGKEGPKPSCSTLKAADPFCLRGFAQAVTVYGDASLAKFYTDLFTSCGLSFSSASTAVRAAVPLSGPVPEAPKYQQPAVNFVTGGRTCANGDSPLPCTSEPCATPCRRYPTAQCVADQCDGCKAKFNQQVGIPGDTVGWGVNCTCPDNSEPVACVPDPCAALSCPAHPDAYCVQDLCFGCNAFFMKDGVEVDCGVFTKFPGTNVTAGVTLPPSTTAGAAAPSILQSNVNPATAKPNVSSDLSLPGATVPPTKTESGSVVLAPGAAAVLGNQTLAQAGTPTGAAAGVLHISRALLMAGIAGSLCSLLCDGMDRHMGSGR